MTTVPHPLDCKMFMAYTFVRIEKKVCKSNWVAELVIINNLRGYIKSWFSNIRSDSNCFSKIYHNSI